MEFQAHQFESCDAQLPPGFRFHPTDEELITYYLLKKVLDGSFTSRAIAEIDLNKCEPWELPEKAKMGEKEWYFFSLRDRKYPTGLRTNRATEAGYWKATGKDREIYSSRTCALVGMKKTLVFYRGRAPKGEKSNWVMHEYRLEGKFNYHFLSRSSKDEWVVSRVFQKVGTGGKKTRMGMTAPPPTVYADMASPPSFGGAAGESSSYESHERDHVPCFSTVPSYPSSNFTPLQYLTSPPPKGGASGGGAVFPSLRQFQDNLQLSPAFFSELPAMTGSACDGGWALELERKMDVGRLHLPVGPTSSTVLDCLQSLLPL